MGRNRVKGAVKNNNKGRKTQPNNKSESFLKTWLDKTPKTPEVCVVKAKLQDHQEPKCKKPTEEDQSAIFRVQNCEKVLENGRN